MVEAPRVVMLLSKHYVRGHADVRKMGTAYSVPRRPRPSAKALGRLCAAWTERAVPVFRPVLKPRLAKARADGGTRSACDFLGQLQ